MNAQPPLIERDLPPEAARRIRAAIMAEEPTGRPRRWVAPVAAGLVLLAILAAWLVWPRTPEGRIANPPSASPTRIELSWTPTPVVGTPPIPRPRSTVPARRPAGPWPTSSSGPFATDRGSLPAGQKAAAVKFCDGESGSDHDALVMYVRRVSNGVEDIDVVFFRDLQGREWVCIPDTMLIPLDRIAVNSSRPVVADTMPALTGSDGVRVEWATYTHPTIERIQVRAIVKGKPTRWFEAEVHDGFAYLPIFTPGHFRSAAGVRPPHTYEHRAFDRNGRQVPVVLI